MQKYSDVVLDKSGKAVQGATVTVITYPAGDPATIYAADGGPAVASVKTDQYGRFAFYAPTGHYSFTVDGTGITPITYNDVTLFDPSDLAAGTGSSLMGFIQSLAGAVKRWVLVKLRERVSPADFGAMGDGIADDSNAIELCANSGARKIDYCGLSYKVTRQIRLHTSGVTHDLRGATITQSTTNTDIFLIGYDGSSFAKTDDTTFLGGSLVGADNGLTSSISTGIGVYAPAVVPYAEGAGCSRIKVLGTKFSGFCTSISATAADAIEVDGIYSTNMQYHASVGAGGYGVLMQSCFNVTIGARNLFKAGTNSRHAIYISADPGRTKDANNVCKGVSIGACRIEWEAATGTTGFEAAIYVRGAFNVTICGPIISGAYGGVVYDLENAPGENITIIGVQSTGTRSTASGEVSGVQFSRSTGAYRAKNVTVTGCTVQLAGANTHGIQLAYADGVTCGGHTIGRVGDSYISGIYTVSCNNVTINPSTICGTWSSAAMDFAVVSDNVQIGRPVISGAGLKYKFYTTPTNLRYGYPRAFVLAANGSGGVTATSYDGEVLTTAAASDANGFTVTLSPELSPNVDNFSALALGSSIANIYHRTLSGQTVTFGVLGIAAGALAPLPAASNSYSVQITLNH